MFHSRRRQPLQRSFRGTSKRTRRALALEPLEDRTLLATSGPRIIALSPTEVRNAAFDHIDVTFDKAIDPASFTTADVAIAGPSGPVAVTTVDALDAVTYRVSFPALAERGSYQATVG